MPSALRRRLSLLAAAALLCAQPLPADVTAARLTKSGGFNGMGAFQSSSTEEYRGTDHRMDATVTYTGAVMSRLAGGARTDIIRVAEDKTYAVDHKHKTYRESSISESARLMKERQGGGKPKGAEPPPPSQRITRSRFDVEAVGQKKSVGKFPCELYRVTLVIEAEDVKTGEKSETRMVTESWNTVETAPLKALRQAEKTFGQAYLKKLGWDLSPDDMQKTGAGMAALMGLNEAELKPKLAELGKKMETVKGYPVAVEMKWFSDRQGAGAPPPPAPAARDEAPDLSRGPAGLLAGMASRMAEKKMRESREKKREASGDQPLFSSYTELQSVEEKTLPADRFQPPAGYKLEKK